MEEEKRFLQLGGIGGLLGGAITLLATIILFSLTPPPDTPEGFLMRFPGLSGVFFVYHRLTLVGILLLIPFFLGWYRSLRKVNLPFALLGGVLGVLALAMLAVLLAIELTSTPTVAALYEAAAAPEARASVVVAYTVQTGIVFGIALSAVYFFGIGFISFGIAMLGSGEAQRGYGWLTLILGALTIVLVLLGLSLIGRFSLFVITLVVGWKLYSLSRAA